MKVTNLLRNESNDMGESFELLSFRGSDSSGETMEDGVVSVDERGGGGKGGLVPVFVSWENGGLGIVVDFDDICFEGVVIINIS